MERQKALLIVGSPKGLKSTSHVLGSTLLEKLKSGGMVAEEIIVGAALHSEESLEKMQGALEEADLVVFSFPLFVDQVPAPLIKTLELIAHRRAARRPEQQQRIMAIVQCGFPENIHNQPACGTMRQFAREAGFVWAGILAMGMGGFIGGRPLEKAGGVVRNVVKALDLAAAALLRGEAIPDEAAEIMGKPLMPRWLYMVAANWGFRRQLKKRGTRKQADARPYEA